MIQLQCSDPECCCYHCDGGEIEPSLQDEADSYMEAILLDRALVYSHIADLALMGYAEAWLEQWGVIEW